MRIRVASQPPPTSTLFSRRTSWLRPSGEGKSGMMNRVTMSRPASTHTCGAVESAADVVPITKVRRPSQSRTCTALRFTLNGMSCRTVTSSGWRYTPEMSGRKGFPSAIARTTLPPRTT